MEIAVLEKLSIIVILLVFLNISVLTILFGLTFGVFNKK